MNGKTIYFDCYSGISGDMALGALIDAGVSVEHLKKILSKMDLDGYSLEAEKVSRGGLAGTKAVVSLEDKKPVERHLSHILKLIESSELPGPVKEKSSAVFKKLAEAEAAVHGMPVEKVHFHEVGAVDAIVDIVGTVAALYLLQADKVICSPLPLGRGEVQTAHGRLPLPAPATLKLMTMRQVPIKGVNYEFEMVTPTGAAIVTTLAESFGPFPSFTVSASGYGAGTIDPGYPNYLRVILGESSRNTGSYEEEVRVIETNIDDQNPEHFGYLMDQLFLKGALDVYFTPIQMKKNRPAVQLTIIAPPEKAEALKEIVFYETSSLGLRIFNTIKEMRPRVTVTVDTGWGPVRVKTTPSLPDQAELHFAPEYEDCKDLARKTGLPLKEIYRITEMLFRKQMQK
ncbi:MAG: nickel pincer cofactor biosynthesis protein LarC [Bacillota bacterium]